MLFAAEKLIGPSVPWFYLNPLFILLGGIVVLLLVGCLPNFLNCHRFHLSLNWKLKAAKLNLTVRLMGGLKYYQQLYLLLQLESIFVFFEYRIRLIDSRQKLPVPVSPEN